MSGSLSKNSTVYCDDYRNQWLVNNNRCRNVMDDVHCKQDIKSDYLMRWLKINKIKSANDLNVIE